MTVRTLRTLFVYATGCRLRLDDRAEHITVGLQLGINFASIDSVLAGDGRRQRTASTVV